MVATQLPSTTQVRVQMSVLPDQTWETWSESMLCQWQGWQGWQNLNQLIIYYFEVLLLATSAIWDDITFNMLKVRLNAKKLMLKPQHLKIASIFRDPQNPWGKIPGSRIDSRSFPKMKKVYFRSRYGSRSPGNRLYEMFMKMVTYL